MRIVFSTIMLFLLLGCQSYKQAENEKSVVFLNFENPDNLHTLSYENLSAKDRILYVVREKSGNYVTFSGEKGNFRMISSRNEIRQISRNSISLKQVENNGLINTFLNTLHLVDTSEVFAEP